MNFLIFKLDSFFQIFISSIIVFQRCILIVIFCLILCLRFVFTQFWFAVSKHAVTTVATFTTSRHICAHRCLIQIWIKTVIAMIWFFFFVIVIIIILFFILIIILVGIIKLWLRNWLSFFHLTIRCICGLLKHGIRPLHWLFGWYFRFFFVMRTLSFLHWLLLRSEGLLHWCELVPMEDQLLLTVSKCASHIGTLSIVLVSLAQLGLILVHILLWSSNRLFCLGTLRISMFRSSCLLNGDKLSFRFLFIWFLGFVIVIGLFLVVVVIIIVFLLWFWFFLFDFLFSLWLHGCCFLLFAKAPLFFLIEYCLILDIHFKILNLHGFILFILLLGWRCFIIIILFIVIIVTVYIFIILNIDVLSLLLKLSLSLLAELILDLAIRSSRLVLWVLTIIVRLIPIRVFILLSLFFNFSLHYLTLFVRNDLSLFTFFFRFFIFLVKCFASLGCFKFDDSSWSLFSFCLL